MKIKLFLTVILACTMSLAACSNGNEATGNNNSETNNNGVEKSAESSEPIVIQMANHHPAGHFLNDVNQTFMDRAVELSGGKIKFEYFPGSQLGTITEIAGLVKDGAIDMGYCFPLGAGFLPLNSVVTLPSLSTNPIDGGKVYDQLLDGVLKEELERNNMKKIFSFLNPPDSILTTQTKVASTDDLNGLKLAVTGGILSHIPGLFGGTGVTLAVTDRYEATEKGVVEGGFFNISSAPSYHLNEVTDYVFTGTNFGVVNQFYAMNMDKWNSLPEDLQSALLQAGEEATALNAEVITGKEQEALQAFKQQGIEITRATPEQHKQILNDLASLDELWVEDMVKKGIDKGKATKVLEEYRSLTEKAVKK